MFLFMATGAYYESGLCTVCRKERRAQFRNFELLTTRSSAFLVVNRRAPQDLTRQRLRNLVKNLRKRGFKHHFIDHKRPIKAIKPFAFSLSGRSSSFHDLFYAVSELKQLCLLKNGN